MKWWVWPPVAIAGALLAVFLWYFTAEIERQAVIDEAQPADAIIVLGAAEYRGRPSPVLRARLDHALDLYRKGNARRILTTGGAGGDPLYTESEVGRKYLAQNGVPVEAIIVETVSESTAQSAVAAAEIMRRMNLESCIVVSDGYHIYRAKRMLQDQGLIVYGSPRQSGSHGTWQYRLRCLKEALLFLVWYAGIRL